MNLKYIVRLKNFFKSFNDIPKIKNIIQSKCIDYWWISIYPYLIFCYV